MKGIVIERKRKQKEWLTWTRQMKNRERRMGYDERETGVYLSFEGSGVGQTDQVCGQGWNVVGMRINAKRRCRFVCREGIVITN